MKNELIRGCGKLLNNKEVDEWMFEMAQKRGYLLMPIKGTIGGERVNIAYRCVETGEVKHSHWENGVLGNAQA